MVLCALFTHEHLEDKENEKNVGNRKSDWKRTTEKRSASV